MKEAQEAGIERRVTWTVRAEKEPRDGARNRTVLDSKCYVSPNNRTTSSGVSETVYERVPCLQSGHGERSATQVNHGTGFRMDDGKAERWQRWRAG